MGLIDIVAMIGFMFLPIPKNVSVNEDKDPSSTQQNEILEFASGKIQQRPTDETEKLNLIISDHEEEVVP
jgi:hypothetical protein